MNKLTYKNNRLLKHFPLKYDNGKKSSVYSTSAFTNTDTHRHICICTHLYRWIYTHQYIYTQ